MDDLIERNIALNDINYVFRKHYLKIRSKNNSKFLIDLCNDICEGIYKIPEADVERHAYWVDNGVDYRGANWFKCSECGRTLCEHYNIAVDEEYPYCHCGCKMKKEIK